MKIKQITETTTAGVIATVDSPLGATQSRSNPSIYGGKKVGTLFKGKKTSAPYANSITESADISEAELQEDDIIMVPGQGRKLKTGFVPHGKSRIDHEVEMARSDLFSAAQNAQKVFAMIKDMSEEEGLEGWVQEKIIKANDYLNTVREYLEGKQLQTEMMPAGVITNGNMGESQLDELSKDTLKSYVKKQPERIKGQQGLARTNPNKAERIVDPKKGDIRRALNKLKDPKYGNAEPSMDEGAKVDRMVKHIASSEKKLGHSKKEAENIAWATANKRGMLDNKNKKA